MFSMCFWLLSISSVPCVLCVTLALIEAVSALWYRSVKCIMPHLNYNNEYHRKWNQRLIGAFKTNAAVWVSSRSLHSFVCCIWWCWLVNDPWLRLMSRYIPAFQHHQCLQVLCLCVCFNVSQCGERTAACASICIDPWCVTMVCTQSALVLWWKSPYCLVNTHPECAFICFNTPSVM